MRPGTGRGDVHPAGSSRRVRWSQGLQYLIAAGLFNGFPLPQNAGGLRRALKTLGEILDRGGCPLVFPEGRRSPDGGMGPFQPGIGAMAIRLRVPVVPVHLHGLWEILPPGGRLPRPGRVRVRIGAPLHLSDLTDNALAAGRVEAAVRGLAAPAQ